MKVPIITSTVLSMSEVLLTHPVLGPSYWILLEALVPLVKYTLGRFVDLKCRCLLLEYWLLVKPVLSRPYLVHE